jgi:hypothetical protein
MEVGEGPIGAVAPKKRNPSRTYFEFRVFIKMLFFSRTGYTVQYSNLSENTGN